MEWLISANSNIYDHKKAFEELPYIDWKQNNYKYSVGDIVYIYTTTPVSAIEYVTKVIKTDMPFDEFLDDEKYWINKQKYEEGKVNSRYVRLKLIKRFQTGSITYKQLQEHGLTGNLQGARKLCDENGNLKPIGQYIHDQVNIIETNDFNLRNEQLDDDLKLEISKTNIDGSITYEYSKDIKPIPKLIENKSKKIYLRSKAIAINALGIAHFKCEINKNHKTFIRKKDGLPYTEPHHLIPMAYQDLYETSIDIEENIVSLCSNCHNEIHYGKNAKELIKKLFDERVELLASKNIHITIDELLSYYKISDNEY